MTSQKIRLTLDVEYDLNGTSVEEMSTLLRKMVERAIGEGLLTGYSEAEVNEYSMDTQVLPDLLTEKEVADFMLDRIENGQLGLEDIPARLARYGLMEAPKFVAEIRERIEALAEGS